MEASQVPAAFIQPWAVGAGTGYIRQIPAASQIADQPGAASLEDGFPPLCFKAIAAGGVWPFGQDTNGILNWITQAIQWQQAGAPVAFNAAFQTAIGGYPNGTIIASATTAGVWWRSTTDNNATNPDQGGAGWQPWPGWQAPLAAEIARAQAAEALRVKYTDFGGSFFKGSGYLSFPDQFMFQWIYISTYPGTNQVPFLLPTAFPNNFFGTLLAFGASTNSATAAGSIGVSPGTASNPNDLSHFIVSNNYPASSPNNPDAAMVLAIGN